MEISVILTRDLVTIKKTIDCCEKLVKIALEIGDRPGDGGAYGNLGDAYESLGDHQKAIEYHNKLLKIATEMGDRRGEGAAYGKGIGYRDIGTLILFSWF